MAWIRYTASSEEEVWAEEEKSEAEDPGINLDSAILNAD